MQALKAGCVLINLNTKKIGLIFRQKQKDYSFPKGHLEQGESIFQCAIRETAEETKRDCELFSTEPLSIMRYYDSVGDEAITYYFLAKDIGPSKNASLDVHELHWIDVDKVEETLSYANLKEFWDEIKDKVLEKLK